MNIYRNIKSFCFHSGVLLLAIYAVSCSSGDASEGMSNVVPNYKFPSPILEWGASATEIKTQMIDKGCTMTFEGMEHYTSNIYIYRSDDKSAYISYTFRDHGLNAVNVLFEVSLYSKQEVLEAFNGYEKLRSMGEDVYIDRRLNVIGTLSTVLNKGIEYYSVGWTKNDVEVANAIDLGLSVKWADRNVGSSTDVSAGCQHNCGKLIGWGDPTGNKIIDQISAYPYYADISATKYDIARMQWGDGWRMPTQQEMAELIVSCKWIWSEEEGQKGYKVIGPNGNSIFLPVTGYRRNDVSYGIDVNGYYWTSTHKEQNGLYPYVLNFNRNTHGMNYSSGGMLANPTRSYGCAVRPVIL